MAAARHRSHSIRPWVALGLCVSATLAVGGVSLVNTPDRSVPSDTELVSKSGYHVSGTLPPLLQKDLQQLRKAYRSGNQAAIQAAYAQFGSDMAKVWGKPSIAQPVATTSAAPTTSPPVTVPATVSPTTSTPAQPPTTSTSRSTSLPSVTTDLRSLVGSMQTGTTRSLGAGSYTFSDFGTDHYGVNLPTSTGINGQGPSQTVLSMVPYSSTRSGQVPTVSPATNPLELMRVSGTGVTLSNFTLQATPQGHLYNGLHVDQATNARITNVKVVAVPGNYHIPPGETASIGDWHTTGTQYTNVEVDGAGVGAAGLSVASSNTTTVTDSSFHDNAFSAGVTFWNSQDITLNNVTSVNNYGGLNFEMDSGTATVDRPTLRGNSNDIYIGSTASSLHLVIKDPVLQAGQKLGIYCPTNYNGGPNAQRRSDITVLVNGVDKSADLINWL